MAFHLRPGIDAMRIDESELLKAVGKDELFAVDMAGLSLSKCKITIIVSTADDEPPADAPEIPLVGLKTLDKVVSTAAGNVFIHVHLPEPLLAAGECTRDVT